ncbi:hypothetical protein B296_00034704 [Ensete ventricosum]|uniref:Uncharacterized protein n=1 Tax=Ensete ventricosum TaxID=4639 RepID=A0A426Y9A1_ENSVE|nr:hypothetical protein B296_00034704 [Ensete ventricosum]
MRTHRGLVRCIREVGNRLSPTSHTSVACELRLLLYRACEHHFASIGLTSIIFDATIDASHADGCWTEFATSLHSVMSQFVSRQVRGPSAKWRYHRLGLFPPYYCPKLVGNGRFRSSPPATWWYQSREKEEEGEEKGEPEDLALSSLDDPDPSLPSLARRHR